MGARLLAAALGIWLMAAPSVLGYAGAAMRNDRIIGPLAASFALIAIWEVVRPLRHLNTLLGTWLLVAPWLLGFPPPATINSLLVGAALILLSRVRGPLKQRFAGGWSSLWRGPDDA